MTFTKDHWQAYAGRAVPLGQARGGGHGGAEADEPPTLYISPDKLFESPYQPLASTLSVSSYFNCRIAYA